MSLRDSLELIQAVKPEAGHSALEHEIMAERAASMGAAEKKVETTLAAYMKDKQNQSLDRARQAVWAYFVQRELIGFRRHQDVITAFNIPREVLNGLGVMRK